jgi:hypothetical protein
MEHIIQFAINIDDDRIIKIIEAKAEKEIIKTLTNQVGRQIFQANYHSRDGYDEHCLSDYSKHLLQTFFEDHKTEIIDATAKYLADRLARSKAGKAILGDLK